MIYMCTHISIKLFNTSFVLKYSKVKMTWLVHGREPAPVVHLKEPALMAHFHYTVGLGHARYGSVRLGRVGP